MYISNYLYIKYIIELYRIIYYIVIHNLNMCYIALYIVYIYYILYIYMYIYVINIWDWNPKRMTYCGLLDMSWDLRPGHAWGPFFFSFMFISSESKWGNGLSYFILADQAVCFGATYTFAPVGLSGNHLIIQYPKQDDSNQISWWPP